MKTDDEKIMKQIVKLSKMVAKKLNADHVFIRDNIIKSLNGIVKQNEPKTKEDDENDEYLKSLIKKRNKEIDENMNKMIWGD